MRNRWFQIPLFHTPNTRYEKKVTWLELFYDLIFVAAFIQLGNGLSERVSLSGFASFAGIFLTLWVVWTGFTTFSNRFTVDDFLHRILVICQMFTVGGMAITAPLVLKGEITYFAVTYAIAQGLVSSFYFRAYFQQKIGKKFSFYWGSVFAIGSILWLSSILFQPPITFFVWGIATITILLAPFNFRSRHLESHYPADQEHLSERFGLLTIIVLGESFVKVLSSLSGQASVFTTFFQASMTLLLTCCIWWIYFDDVAGSELKEGKIQPMIWLFAHLPFQLSLIAIGVAIKKTLYFDLDAVVPSKYGWLLCGALSIAFFSVAIIDSVTKRKQSELSDNIRVVVRSISGTLFLLLAATGNTLQSKWFLGVILLICAVQVIFDMAMAPFESSDMPDESVSLTEIAKARKDGNHIVKKMQPTKIIRKGTPNEFRKDFYFFLMEGSWLRVMATFGFIFLVLNLFFAGLFVLQPDSISTSRPNSFIDAFFFSIQTMSTIGYGTMSPVSTYGHIMVSFEVIIGLVSVALLTGLIFAKASRAKASIMFSKNIILTKRHGKNILMFRTGNARGNDVVDAGISLHLLVDDFSPEGDHIRRIKDLKLSRSRSPLFTMSWTIMHEIDEDSPLFNKDIIGDPSIITFIVTLTGHDGTYGQTIYARHMYNSSDIEKDVQFVDVISQMPDGRFMVDYSKFNSLQSLTPEK